MQASEALIATIKQFEGFRATAYKDAVGVWTVGYGSTVAVTPGEIITEGHADLVLRAELAEKAAAVTHAVAPILSQPQFDALLDFAFNLGVGALQKSTLLRTLNNGFLELAAAEFPKWDHAGQKVLPGLKIRRFCEQAWFLGLDPVAYPDEATRQRYLAA